MNGLKKILINGIKPKEMSIGNLIRIVLCK